MLLDDDDIILDGSAISNYLVTKYGGAEYASLCPQEPFPRAMVEQRQHFSDSKLFNLFYKQMMAHGKGGREYDAEDITATLEALDMLEIHLGDNDYVTGRAITVADFSCVSTATALLTIVPHDAARYPKILAWVQRLALLPYFKDIVETTNETVYGFVKEKTGLDNRKWFMFDFIADYNCWKYFIY